MQVRRVAVIAYHSSPLGEPGEGDAGGMTVYVREVAEALARRRVRTDIFTRATPESDRVTEIFPGVRVINIDAGPKEVAGKEALASYVGEFAAGVEDFAWRYGLRYDLVHSHYWQSGLAASALAVAWSVPLVHSQHTLGRVKNRFLPPGGMPEPDSRIAGEEAVMRAADVLVANTDDEWEEMACLYGVSHDRLHTVHPGVDHGLFLPGDRFAARRLLGLGEEAVMLYVGRIQPLKGLELAVRAAEELIPALDRELVLLIVGGASGPQGEVEVQRLERLVRGLGLERHIRFIGPEPHVRLPVYYRAADVLVSCSYSESFGLAALEAHACGTPVVATAVGGLSYIVRDGSSGFLVETRDPAVFAGRLKTVLSDGDLLSAFQKEAVRTASRFSWEQTAESLLQLYECLMREQFREACTR